MRQLAYMMECQVQSSEMHRHGHYQRVIYFVFLSSEMEDNIPPEYLFVFQKKKGPPTYLLITPYCSFLIHYSPIQSSTLKASPLHISPLPIINPAPLNPAWPGQGTRISQHEKQTVFLQVPVPLSELLPVDH